MDILKLLYVMACLRLLKAIEHFSHMLPQDIIEQNILLEQHTMVVPSEPVDVTHHHKGYEFEMIDLLGLGEQHDRLKRQLSLKNSASKFLLEVYNDIAEDESELDHVREHLAPHGSRQRRALREENFITKLDRMEIEKCNNIITFSSKETMENSAQPLDELPIVSDMQIGFNINDVPRDLRLVHSALRIYQHPGLSKFVQNTDMQMATISIYQKVLNRKQHTGALRILTSMNTTTTYKGWLEFNVTRVLGRWLQKKSQHRTNELIVGVTLNMENAAAEAKQIEILPSDLGLIRANSSEEMIDLQPFTIGYFMGPELMAKIQTLRFKRDVIMRKQRKADYYRRPGPPPIPEIYKLPKTCERLNFTLDFKDLQMHNWVIAPKKFEAYFCGGECNFPLGSKMNATNHAIVQTLMHLKQPNLPKPCCVPTVLGAISILHYLNEDSVNLSKYPQSVAKECGCH